MAAPSDTRWIRQHAAISTCGACDCGYRLQTPRPLVQQLPALQPAGPWLALWHAAAVCTSHNSMLRGQTGRDGKQLAVAAQHKEIVRAAWLQEKQIYPACLHAGIG